MHVFVVTPPAPVVDLATAKAHLRYEDDDADALITAYVAAATDHLDGPGGWLGRAIGQQTLEAQFDRFPCGSDDYLDLPYPPLVSVTSVKHDDEDGAEQTLDPSAFVADARGIVSAINLAWPPTYSRRGAVRVRYVAGYDTPPAPIVAAILLMTGDLFANRETTAEGQVGRIPMSTTVESLLAPYRVWGV